MPQSLYANFEGVNLDQAAAARIEVPHFTGRWLWKALGMRKAPIMLTYYH
jgi:hypothetical protein